MRRRIKIEFEDGEGGKYKISIEGSLSREKVLKVMDLVDLLGGTEHEPVEIPSRDTLFTRIFHLLEKKFPLGSFTSTDLREAYEDEFNQPIKLSTISTYLSRLSEKGLLHRERTSIGWVYRRVRLKAT
ncbi:MAG: hypothetical protein RMJ31_05355 [Nitrososphaerota archaeon]|nr:BlaI/MecI/CopY family transcriptional regulator [Nitrososphaerales archaeon]MDW8045184.1 hypothetical protein [Nitrososphaerota archaeon]